MAQSPGTVNMTVAVGIETKRKFVMMCERLHLQKGDMLTNALEDLLTKTDDEIIEIYHGRMTTNRREHFKQQVLEALKDIEERRSDEKGKSGTAKRRQ